MGRSKSVDPRPNKIIEEDIPISYELQNHIYRRVLKIIKDKQCSYDEAWDILKNEIKSKMDDTRNKHSL